jgi:hypothetical protein
MKRPAVSEPLLLILITLACLIPFLNKAFNVDDPLFIWTAKQISIHPFDFYGFKVNWYGTLSPMAEIAKNPPGACYFLALAGSLFGWSEFTLHSAMLIPCVVTALGIFYLAQLLCSKPFLAALAGILTPVFLVSATSVMCDITMLGFWVWSVFFWIRGLRTNRQRYFFFSALMITACSLTKYFGVALLPLLIAYALSLKRRLGLWMCYLLIPIIFFAGYEWATDLLYGHGLLGDAVLYANKHQSIEYRELLLNVLITLSFTGGCVVSVFFYAPLLWSRSSFIIGTALMILLFVVLSRVQEIGFVPTYDGTSVKWFLLAQLVLMVMTGVSIIALALGDFYTFRNQESFLLLLWVIGTFIFAGFVNWTINARSILPMVPAVGILFIRRIELHSNSSNHGRGTLWAAWPLIPGMCIAIMVSWSDYMWAGTARQAAFQIAQTFEKKVNSNLWFLGHWGFQYYQESHNGKAIDLKHQEVLSGDIVIIPLNNTYGQIKNIASFQKQNPLIQQFEVEPRQWITTMNQSMGAGFYSRDWGPLPFAFGIAGPEKYYAYVIRQQPS